jgi:hypothetical protein
MALPLPANPLPPVLSYAAPQDQPTPWTPLRIAQLALGLPGLAAPFVGFTFGTSPLDCVRSWPDDVDDSIFFLLGSAFFTAFPIVAWQIRRLALAAAPRRWERATLATMAVITLLPPTLIVLQMLVQLARSWEAAVLWDAGPTLLSGIAPLAAGVALWIVRRRRGRAIAAMETLLVTGYLANAAMCLLAFHTDPELGYWLTVSATASFAIDWLRPRA